MISVTSSHSNYLNSPPECGPNLEKNHDSPKCSPNLEVLPNQNLVSCRGERNGLETIEVCRATNHR